MFSPKIGLKMPQVTSTCRKWYTVILVNSPKSKIEKQSTLQENLWIYSENSFFKTENEIVTDVLETACSIWVKLKSQKSKINKCFKT